MKRAYSPKEIAAKKWVTLPWDEKWSKPFGFPAENASWFISGASASGKSSFVMQLGKELCNYGTVLYMSYEEKINQSFQRRMGYLKMNEVQGKFRVVTEGSLEEVIVLRHVILSHHGLLEYGSPVRPQIMEAEILHMIDNIDAEMMMMLSALDKVGPGEMTNRIFAMENRAFYKPNLD